MGNFQSAAITEMRKQNTAQQKITKKKILLLMLLIIKKHKLLKITILMLELKYLFRIKKKI
jgi:hypothetical protein